MKPLRFNWVDVAGMAVCGYFIWEGNWDAAITILLVMVVSELQAIRQLLKEKK